MSVYEFTLTPARRFAFGHRSRATRCRRARRDNAYASAGSADADHGLAHNPRRQTWPGEHTVPHAPQFLGSIVVLVQRLPQFIVVGGHVSVPMHLPPSHFSPGRQAIPQAPQFATSVIVRTQRAPHNVSPALHIAPLHVPPRHAWPAAQTFPHAPQSVASVWRFEQRPPQRSCPPGQLATQFPPKQTSPAAQAIPH